MKQILIVIDMQNDFISGSLGSEEAKLIVKNVVEICKKYTIENIYATRDTHYNNYLETLEGKNLPIEHCLKDSNGWQIIDELKDYILEENIFNKEVFGSIELAKRMKKLAEKEEIEITLVGVCTDICVISNALLLKTYLPNTSINVIENCCAATSKENQKYAIEMMKSNQIKIVSLNIL